MILKPHTDIQSVNLTPPQMGLILGLEPLLSDPDLHLWLMCPTCLQEHNDPSLVTDNAPEDLIWKIDCRCRQRRIPRSSVVTTMPPAAGLLVHAQELLKDAHLVIRCHSNRPDCRHSPLHIKPEGKQGWLVACGCARRHFRPKQRTTAA